MSDQEQPTERDALVRMPLGQLLTFWRPGSHDWTWLDEYNDLLGDPRTLAIERRIVDEGIGFVDDAAPITLGGDGRVWDGHHRIVLAIELGIPEVMVVTVPRSEDEPTETFAISGVSVASWPTGDVLTYEGRQWAPLPPAPTVDDRDALIAALQSRGLLRAGHAFERIVEADLSYLLEAINSAGFHRGPDGLSRRTAAEIVAMGLSRTVGGS